MTRINGGHPPHHESYAVDPVLVLGNHMPEIRLYTSKN